jgi:hypothetical protein
VENIYGIIRARGASPYLPIDRGVKVMKLYKVKDVKNIIYMITTDILLAQAEVLRQEKIQHAKPLSIFIAVKTI